MLLKSHEPTESEIRHKVNFLVTGDTAGCHNWRHRRLSLRQPAAPTVMTRFTLWRLLVSLYFQQYCYSVRRTIESDDLGTWRVHDTPEWTYKWIALGRIFQWFGASWFFSIFITENKGKFVATKLSNWRPLISSDQYYFTTMGKSEDRFSDGEITLEKYR